jgi:hypothetical protein
MDATAINVMPVRIAPPASAENAASFSMGPGLLPGGVAVVLMTCR